jgi:hypothetical protein
LPAPDTDTTFFHFRHFKLQRSSDMF